VIATLASEPLDRIRQRRGALERYLRDLHPGAPSHGAHADSPPPVAGRAAELAADPWVRRQLSAYFDGPGDPSPCSELVAQTLAAVAKIEADGERLERVGDRPREDRYALEAELLLGTAIGMALLREGRRIVEDALGAGEGALGKHVTRLQHELRRVVSAAEAWIAASERERAEALADSLTDRPRVESAAPAPGRVAARARRRPSRRESWRLVLGTRRDAPDRASMLPSRTELLAVAVVTTLAAWVAVTGFSGLARRGPVPPNGSSLHAVEGVARVVARPPCVYLTLDPAAWASFDEPLRRRVVARASAIAAGAGYTGVLFRNPDETVVAVTVGRETRWAEPEYPPAAPTGVALYVPP
jgi:hypothetical protein